jgi:vacuolar-type H+-ATPase subunit H
MVPPISPEELSPLDQIRQTEAEVTRAGAVARQAAEQIIAKAQREAIDIQQDARELGVREGEARYRELITTGEEEARGIVAEAQVRANEMRRKGQQRMNLGIHKVFRIVIGLGEDAIDR